MRGHRVLDSARMRMAARSDHAVTFHVGPRPRTSRAGPVSGRRPSVRDSVIGRWPTFSAVPDRRYAAALHVRARAPGQKDAVTPNAIPPVIAEFVAGLPVAA
jgi:hypothetical protein